MHWLALELELMLDMNERMGIKMEHEATNAGNG